MKEKPILEVKARRRCFVGEFRQLALVTLDMKPKFIFYRLVSSNPEVFKRANTDKLLFVGTKTGWWWRNSDLRKS